MKIKILFPLLFCSITAAAQDANCNQETWMPSDAKKIPKGVCIPQGMFNYITYVRDMTDINGDGLEDFICDWNVKPLHDGDTLYLSVYLQNPDSTFSHFKTFVNLFPIFFQRYDWNYIPEDTSLIPMLQKYEGFDPFSKLKFEKDLIILHIEYAAKEELVLRYRFDMKKQDWLYELSEIRSTIDNDVEPLNLSDKIGPSISKFSYTYWVREAEE